MNPVPATTVVAPPPVHGKKSAYSRCFELGFPYTVREAGLVAASRRLRVSVTPGRGAES